MWQFHQILEDGLTEHEFYAERGRENARRFSFANANPQAAKVIATRGLKGSARANCLGFQTEVRRPWTTPVFRPRTANLSRSLARWAFWLTGQLYSDPVGNPVRTLGGWFSRHGFSDSKVVHQCCELSRVFGPTSTRVATSGLDARIAFRIWYTLIIRLSFEDTRLSDVTRILSQIEAGDPSAAELLPLVYEELRKLAAARLAHEQPGQTLQATALVHEAYVRLVDVDKVQRWNSRGHFFGAAAEAMRRILLNRARDKGRLKRGPDQESGPGKSRIGSRCSARGFPGT